MALVPWVALLCKRQSFTTQITENAGRQLWSHSRSHCFITFLAIALTDQDQDRFDYNVWDTRHLGRAYNGELRIIVLKPVFLKEHWDYK